MGDVGGFLHYTMSPEVRELKRQADRWLWLALLALVGAAVFLALMNWLWQFILVAIPVLLSGLVANARKEDLYKRYLQAQRRDFEDQRHFTESQRRRFLSGEPPAPDASLAVKLRYVERVRRMNPDRILTATLDEIELEAYRKHVGFTRLGYPARWEVELHLAVIGRLREADTEGQWRSVCDEEELAWRRIAMGADGRSRSGESSAPAVSRTCVELLKLAPQDYFDIILAHRPSPLRPTSG